MSAKSRKMMQDLLYLQCGSTSLLSGVVGMSILENGVLSDGPENSEDWPYRNVLEAIRDGWRVVQFPVIASAPSENRCSYVPCEFILERMAEVNSDGE